MPRKNPWFLLIVAALVIAACGGTGNPTPATWTNSAPQADTTPPSQPAALTAVPMGSTVASLSWSSSTDNMGVTAYIVSRNGTQVAAPVTTSYLDSNLSAATTYTYTVAARDAAGNTSTNSASVSVTTTASVADTTPPSQPTGLAAAAAGSTGATLSWNPSTDNVGVTGYILRRNGVQIATSTATTYSDTALSAATTYTYTVAARDAAGNTSTNSASVSVTTAASVADTTPPSQPSGFAAAAAGSTGATLSWNPSTDNVGVTGYILRRNGVQIATSTATTYSDTALSAATTYTYTVAARDAAGNTSTAASASVVTAPSNSAALAWDAVVAANLSGYRIYFGTAPRTYLQPLGQGASVGNVTTHTVTGLSSATRYYFAVTATDTLGNESAYSNEAFKDIP
jgi:chitodextrinase